MQASGLKCQHHKISSIWGNVTTYMIYSYSSGNLSVCAQMHKHMQRVKLNMKALLLSLHRSENLLSATKSYYIHLSITEQG